MKAALDRQMRRLPYERFDAAYAAEEFADARFAAARRREKRPPGLRSWWPGARTRPSRG